MMPANEETKKIELGQHSVVFEPPDLLVVTFRGVVRAEDAASYVARRIALLEGASCVLTLVGVRDSAARKIIAEISDPRPSATAFFGGSFAFRVVAEMVANASRIVSKRNTIVAFFADEPAARAWLVDMRKQFKAT